MFSVSVLGVGISADSKSVQSRDAQRRNDLPQPQPLESQAPAEAKQQRISDRRRKQKARRLLAVGNWLVAGCASTLILYAFGLGFGPRVVILTS